MQVCENDLSVGGVMIVGDFTPSAEMQSLYSTSPADWVQHFRISSSLVVAFRFVHVGTFSVKGQFGDQWNCVYLSSPSSMSRIWHIVVILLGKVCIQLFSFQVWVNSWVDWYDHLTNLPVPPKIILIYHYHCSHYFLLSVPHLDYFFPILASLRSFLSASTSQTLLICHYLYPQIIPIQDTHYMNCAPMTKPVYRTSFFIHCLNDDLIRISLCKH